jgi:hypothetical protein
MAKLFGAASDARARPSAAARPVTVARQPAARSRAAASSAWHRVFTPNLGSNDNDLLAIAGRSPSDIWAVGSLLPSPNATIMHTLAEHYDGKRWAAVRTPRVGTEASSLYGVAALPDGTAWSVGIRTQNSGHTSRSLAEHWDGRAWTVVPTPNPGSADDMLYGVTAVSDSDVWAVGGYSGADNAFHPLLEHWDGHSWSVAAVPGRACSTACSARSPPRRARGWRIVASPNPSSNGNNILFAATAFGPHDVWAVGEWDGQGGMRTLALHYTGS